MRVLLAEDDVTLGPIVAQGLREQSYAVDLVADGAAALHATALHHYDLVILDVLMPEHNGFDVCRALRACGSRVPVLMLTARDTVDDKIAGLDAGADDFLTKPFAFRELLARLRALLRRGPHVWPSIITVADLRIDTGSHGVERGDERSRCRPNRTPCSNCSHGMRARSSAARTFARTFGTSTAIRSWTRLRYT